jgi:hypothetical protein
MIGRLFDIRFSHSFFADGVFQGWQLRPDSATQELMVRYRLLARMDAGRWSLNADEDPGVLLRYLQAQMPGQALVFSLVFAPARFRSITDLPLDWCGRLDMSSKDGELEGDVVRLKAVQAAQPGPGNGAVGVISIYLDDLLGLGGRPPRFAVDFAARQLYWTYFLINRGQIKLDYPKISGGNGYVFEGPRPIQLENGDEALCFSSGIKSFPMQEVPTIMFDLLDSLHPGAGAEQLAERCVIKGLPTPNENRLDLRLAVGKPHVSNAMYVYL